jgi:hypothetical protein
MDGLDEWSGWDTIVIMMMKWLVWMSGVDGILYIGMDGMHCMSGSSISMIILNSLVYQLWHRRYYLWL